MNPIQTLDNEFLRLFAIRSVGIRKPIDCSIEKEQKMFGGCPLKLISNLEIFFRNEFAFVEMIDEL